MREYIEREAALESVREKLRITESLPDTIAKSASVFTLASMNDSLKSIPTADVRPVVRGEWHKRLNVCYSPFDGSSEWIYFCNVCRHMQDSETPFCPCCGADMKGGDGNG